MTPKLRQMLEDRLTIKATQVLRRRITTKELTVFFIKHTHDAERIEQEFTKQLDKLLEKYLEDIR